MGQEIQSAIQAGKEVTFHERGINAHGFSGYGYIITDPDTGGGAYLIEGRGNGGWLTYDDIKNIIYTMLGVVSDLISVVIALKDYIINIAGMLWDGCPASLVFAAALSMSLFTGALLFLGATIYGMAVIGFLGAFAIAMIFGYMINAMWGGWRSACKVS